MRIGFPNMSNGLSCRTLLAVFIALGVGSSPAALYPQEEQPVPQEDSLRGQEAEVTETASGTVTDSPYRRISELIDTDVAGREEDLNGTIVDVVFAMSGEVTHLIVEFDTSRSDFPSLDEQRFMIESDRFGFGTVYQITSIDITGNDLRDVPVLVDGRIPASVGGTDPRMQLLLGSEVLDYEVLGRNRTRLGTVDDIVIELDSMQVAYLAVTSGGGFLGIGRKFRAVPLNEISRMETAQQTFHLDMDRQRWEQLPDFDRDYWPEESAGRVAPTEEADALRTEPLTDPGIDPGVDDLSGSGIDNPLSGPGDQPTR